MTTPHDDLLFDVATPPTPAERLLLLADQYVQHNDTLDRLMGAARPSSLDAHAASAQLLASATRTTIKAVTDERLYESHAMWDAMVRLHQLAFLSSASADQTLQAARTMTALAPEAALGCAESVAQEITRARGRTGVAPLCELTAAQHGALREIACGHIAATRSLGRQYVRYRDEQVLIGTLRSLEAKGLAERVTASVPSVYAGGPPQDRVRLTAAGTTALAAALPGPSTARPSGKAPAPSPITAKTASRSR
ncbi:hypothetical protein ACFC0S_00095 [Streptomyces sp. NPDC056084]|uniref:hypothetical protein n=1 Tax=unclassified Streptomyces TaxID=2593676 RepID=UPI0035D984D8